MRTQIKVNNKWVDGSPAIGEWFKNEVATNVWQEQRHILIDKPETERVWRDSELSRTDNILQADRPDSASILTYRQELRDYPSSDGFPDTRPTL